MDVEKKTYIKINKTISYLARDIIHRSKELNQVEVIKVMDASKMMRSFSQNQIFITFQEYVKSCLSQDRRDEFNLAFLGIRFYGSGLYY